MEEFWQTVLCIAGSFIFGWLVGFLCGDDNGSFRAYGDVLGRISSFDPKCPGCVSWLKGGPFAAPEKSEPTHTCRID